MVVLSDLIQRDQWAREVLRASIRKSVFWQSGLIVNDSELSRLMEANVGAVFEFDYFLDLADNEGRISDDSTTVATTDGITTDTDRAVANFRNRSWGSRNITANLSTTGDPLVAIAGRIGAYWGRQMDFTVISLVKGIMADNVANDASDMVNDISAELGDLAVININAIHDTVQTAGDHQDMLGAMICHSAVKTKLIKDGVTDKIYSDGGEYLYEALAGRRLVVTDSVETVGGVYTSYIIGAGVIGYGEGSPKMPTEVERSAAIGNGAGEETLWNRKNFCLHPYGFSFNSTTMASTSPTNAELELAVNWTRNTDRKRVAFAALKARIVAV